MVWYRKIDKSQWSGGRYMHIAELEGLSAEALGPYQEVVLALDMVNNLHSLVTLGIKTREDKVWQVTDHLLLPEVQALMAHSQAAVDLGQIMTQFRFPQLDVSHQSKVMWQSALLAVGCLITFAGIEYVIFLQLGASEAWQVFFFLGHAFLAVVMFLYAFTEDANPFPFKKGFQIALFVICVVMFIVYASFGVYSRG